MKKSDAPIRKPRADAARNRELLLEAAKRVFTEAGARASLEEIAREAGVGIGTLYRHFPTREALLEAVYRYEVERLAAAADKLLAKHEPLDAMRAWLQLCLDYLATKKVVLSAFTPGAPAPAFESTFELLKLSLTKLLKAAIDAGDARKDVQVNDLIQVFAGFAYNVGAPGWRASTMRLVDIVIAGLATR